MCIVEISRDGCYFHQHNNDRIKANEELDFCFCGGSEKSRFEWLHKEEFKIFLNFTYFFFYKFLILLGNRSKS